MGIGLNICKAIIDLIGYGNSITIKSEKNKGTEISFDIF